MVTILKVATLQVKGCYLGTSYKLDNDYHLFFRFVFFFFWATFVMDAVA